jgi:hypothetical protein
MSNPTTPFNWQMPTNTDLVTDLPADFEVFGQAVATSMADLLGGTTGQILAKATNADMDFTWIANDQGDITGITATSPLTGGGTSGAITVGIQASSTTQSGAVQLTDSTSSTSTTTAATPNSVKTSYDLADAAIPKSTVTTAGDIIFRNSTVPTRLGIGTAGQVLKVNSGATAPEWGSASAGALVLTGSADFTTSSAVNINNCFSATYLNYLIQINITAVSATDMDLAMRLRVGGTDNSSANYFDQTFQQRGNTTGGNAVNSATSWSLGNMASSKQTQLATEMTIFDPFASITTKALSHSNRWNSSDFNQFIMANEHRVASSFDGCSFIPGSGTITGKIRIYGYALS